LLLCPCRTNHFQPHTYIAERIDLLPRISPSVPAVRSSPVASWCKGWPAARKSRRGRAPGEDRV